MRVLVIGGYGFFGEKLCKLLADETGLTLLIAGRNLDKAEAVCARYAGKNTAFIALKLDRNKPLDTQIDDQKNDLIIDVSGPFQAYGNNPYRVVEYALSIGVHYFDIADGSDFVKGITTYNDKAVKENIAIISGVSTYPALTSAVVSDLSENFHTVTDVRSGIAPSPHADMGRSVIDAIASYAGKPYPVLRHGKIQKAFALTESLKRTICSPGTKPLDPLLFSNVDVPDAQVFGKHFDGLQSVWNGAGPKPVLLHRCLMGLSRLVKFHLVPGLLWLSPLFHFCMRKLSIGRHRGGMFVDVTGLKDDRRSTVGWHLIAEGDDGPLIPVTPLAILVMQALKGEWPKPGARPCLGDVTLADYEAEFAKHNITTGVHSEPSTETCLYENILGSAYSQLPQAVQDLHRNTGTAHFAGRAKIVRGRNPLSHLLANIFRFPKPESNIPVTVTFTARDGIETWVRDFGGRIMQSTQKLGTGRYEHLMVEGFGPFSIGIALVVKDGRLYNIPQNWSFLGVPLPKRLRPGGDIYEHDADGRFNFHVEIKVPLLGRIVKYVGWLERDVVSLTGVTRVADIGTKA